MSAVIIESLNQEGQGVARLNGKTLFIEGALPGERVTFTIRRSRRNYDVAEVDTVLHASAQRAQPRCDYFGYCGGCSMQHFDADAQVAAKQRVLEDTLWHLGRLKAEVLYPAIRGADWGYRYRARLSVRCVPGKGVLIGFHQRKSSYVADLHHCAILPPQVSRLMGPLHGLIANLSCPDRIPQLELAIGDAETVLVLRHLLPLTNNDRAVLLQFAQRHGIQWWLQAAGPESCQPLVPEDATELHYHLPEFDLRLAFRPTDFTQVNFAVNRLLIKRAMQLLEPCEGERIADLFCGLGNFSLPIARLGAMVVGVEGSDALVRRADSNAQRNGLQALSRFYAANLFDTTDDSLAALGRLDKMLIDPPREGAIAVVKAISETQGPRRIVYVSCNPATLARDGAVLVHEKGYRLRGAGIANMFPHTSHVESVAVFDC